MILHRIDDRIGNYHRHLVGEWPGGLLQINFVRIIIEFAAVRVEDLDVRADVVGRAEVLEQRGVGRRDIQQQQALPAGQPDVGRQRIIDAAGDLPGIRRQLRIKERDRVARNVEQFHEFIGRIVIGPAIGRMVHNFRNHDRSHFRSRIRPAQCNGLLGHKVFFAFAGNITSERDLLFGSAERVAMKIAGQISGIIDPENVNFVAIRTEREARRNSGVRIEL